MESAILHQGSYFKVRFEEGVFVFDFDPNIRVDLKMCQEMFDVLAIFYAKMGRAIPTLAVVKGILSMNREARELAKANQELGYVFASATVTSNVILFKMMKVILSVVGSKSLPRAFFTQHSEAIEWLESQRIILGLPRIEHNEVDMIFNANALT
jgi:hypothetical protein